jgi:DNA adenine methylase
VFRERIWCIETADKFILSINDMPEIRELFGAFTIKPVNLTYTAAREGSTPAAELLVRNF